MGVGRGREGSPSLLVEEWGDGEAPGSGQEPTWNLSSGTTSWSARACSSGKALSMATAISVRCSLSRRRSIPSPPAILPRGVGGGCVWRPLLAPARLRSLLPSLGILVLSGEAPASVYTYSPAAERRRLSCSATLLYFQPGKSRGYCLAWSQSGPSFRRLE